MEGSKSSTRIARVMSKKELPKYVHLHSDRFELKFLIIIRCAFNGSGKLGVGGSLMNILATAIPKEATDGKTVTDFGIHFVLFELFEYP